MKISDFNNDLLIEMLLEKNNSGDVSKSISKMNMNIKRAATGARIKPKLANGKLNRALLKKILKLATPAELEVLATQFLGERGLKVVKGSPKK